MTFGNPSESLPSEAFANWANGDDYALLWYRPSEPDRRDAASSLILRFKGRYADAISLIAKLAGAWVSEHETELRGRDIRYVMAAPRSVAGKPNVGCERLAAALASAHPWLTYLPNALVRTRSIQPAHRGGARSIPLHLETIRYDGPALAGDIAVHGLLCKACDAEFADDAWLQRHLASPRHRLAVGDTLQPGVLVIDDVITSGTTMGAIREVLRRDTDVGAVVALAVGRTTRAEQPTIDPMKRGRVEQLVLPQLTLDKAHGQPRGVSPSVHTWAVLFDLDGTLVDSLELKALRDARRWVEVHAAFHLSKLLPGTASMLADVSGMAATGVVTMARRRYAEALLTHHGLGIPVLVGFEDVPRRKPHPDPILRAAELLGIPPSRTIYVGDEGRDMVAAHRAGAHGIAFGADLVGRPEARTATATAQDWAEVVSAVRRIVQG